MLTEEQEEIISAAIQPLFQYLEHEVIVDVANRIKESLSYTRTAELQAISMRELGYSPSKIRSEAMKLLKADEEFRKMVALNTLQHKKMVKRMLEKIQKEAYKANADIMAGAGNMSYANDLSIWKDAGKTLTDDSYLSKLIEAFAKQTKGELKNLTQTTGFKTMSGFESMENLYRRELDKALIKVCSGTFSKEKVIKDTVHELAQSGLRSIDFASGYSMQLDTAVRLAVRTGANQLSGKITDENIEQTGENLVYVSKHWGARNTGEGVANHENWQGKVYYIKDGTDYYEEAKRIGQDRIVNLWYATGYSPDGTHENNPLGMYGYNCRHRHYVWFLGTSSLPNEQEEPKPVTIDGKTYDYYAITQKMRSMERAVRALKREKEALGKLGMDTKEIDVKIKRKVEEYQNFCEKCNVKEKTERMRYECGTSDLKKTKAWNGFEVSVTMQNKNSMNDNKAGKFMRFDGTNTIFEGKEPLEKCQIAKELTEKYVTKKSKWKGTVNVDDEKCTAESIVGRKEWSCTILVSSITQPKTYIHEMLHSRSGSYLSPIKLIFYKKMEEASTELLARQICLNEGISYTYSDRQNVNALMTINKITQIAENDLIFAQKLYNKDIEVRYSWLMNKVNKYIKECPDKADELNECLNKLKGVK